MILLSCFIFGLAAAVTVVYVTDDILIRMAFVVLMMTVAMTSAFTFSIHLAGQNRWPYVIYVAAGVWWISEIFGIVLQATYPRYHGHITVSGFFLWGIYVAFNMFLGLALSRLFKRRR